jgi:hypothetical protein
MSTTFVRNVHPFYRVSLLLIVILLLTNRADSVSVKNGATLSQPTVAPMKFALLVGIDTYQYVPTLDGCVQDVQDMKELLIRKFGFAPQNILTLTNKQATHGGIIEAVKRQLIANSKLHPNAIVVFQYSGHGSQVDDTNGDEADGLDETIVPVDSRDPQNKNFDITDDELSDLFEQLSQYTSNITFILDSCHSGSATRGSSKVRRIAKDTRPQPPQPPLSATRSAAKTRDAETTDILPSSQRYITISGSTSEEVSNEMVSSSGGTRRVNGAMSFYLIRALQDAQPDMSYRELMSEVSNAVNLAYPAQHPQVEGDIRRPIFGGAANREEPFIRVSKVVGKTVTLDAGAAHGIKIGSPIAIYSRSAQKLSGDEKKLGVGTIKSVSYFTSTAVMLEPVAIPKASKAVLIAPDYGTEKLRFAIDTNEINDTKFVSQLRDQLKTISSLEIFQPPLGNAGTAPSWDVALFRGQFGSVFKDKESVAPSSTGDSTLPSPDALVYYLAGKDGAAMFGFFVKPDDPIGPPRVAEALERLTRIRALKAISNKSSTFKRGFRLTPIRVTGTPSESGFNIEKEEPARSEQLIHSFGMGEYFKFQIENQTGKDMYFTLFDLSADGSVKILYPPEGAVELLRAGDKVTPQHLFQTTAPAGFETFKIIATTNKTDFSFLTQSGVARGESPLEELMNLALGRKRSDEVKVVGQDDWTTGQLDFVISGKNRQ